MIRLPRLFLAALAVALLVVLAAPVLAGDVQGKVMSVEPDRFTFAIDEKGKTLTFSMDEDAQVMINGEEANLADLQPGDIVSVLHRRDGDQLMAIEVRCVRTKSK